MVRFTLATTTERALFGSSTLRRTRSATPVKRRAFGESLGRQDLQALPEAMDPPVLRAMMVHPALPGAMG
jgi:hypothetical protein